MTSRAILTLPALLLLAMPPHAQADPPLSAPAAANRIDCTCRANGRRYALGDRVCLVTPSGLRSARCRMAQNVTSWEIEDEAGCAVTAAILPAADPARR